MARDYSTTTDLDPVALHLSAQVVIAEQLTRRRLLFVSIDGDQGEAIFTPFELDGCRTVFHARLRYSVGAAAIAIAGAVAESLAGITLADRLGGAVEVLERGVRELAVARTFTDWRGPIDRLWRRVAAILRRPRVWQLVLGLAAALHIARRLDGGQVHALMAGL